MSKVNAWLYLPMTILVMAVCSPLRAADDQVHVVPASELNQWWQAAPGGSPEPNDPIDDVIQAGGGCIAVAFEIHSDGSVSSERVWRSTLNGSQAGKRLEQLALQAVHQWRFVSTSANTDHDAVYTYHVFTNWLTQLANPMPGAPPMTTASDRRRAELQGEQAGAPCKMSDFPQQVQNMINAAASAKGAAQ